VRYGSITEDQEIGNEELQSSKELLSGSEETSETKNCRKPAKKNYKAWGGN
jgi:hypothetical protein